MAGALHRCGGMTEFAVKPPTIPIPFNKLLKVVAIVDPEAPQIRQLLDHLAAEHFEVEIASDFNRDVSEDAGVGAYLASIDGDCLERARQLVHAVRAIGFRMPLWGLLGRGVDRVQRVPSAVSRPQPDAAAATRADMPGLFSTQSVHKQGAGSRKSTSDRPHTRTAALHRAEAFQRVVSHPRLDLSLLSAVRVSRRQRPGARESGGRSAVGPVHRAWDRSAQEPAVFQERIDGRIKFHTYAVRE